MGFDGTPTFAKAVILGIIAAVSARNFAMAVNRLMDEDIDKDNPRCASRPNISGRIGNFAGIEYSPAFLSYSISCKA